MRHTLRFFRTLLKFGMPAVLLLVPLLAIYGWLSPWPPAAASLARYTEQVPVLVGTSDQSHHSDQVHEVRSSRSYILFPSVLTDPKVTTVAQENGGPVTVDESTTAFWCYLALLLAYGVGTWWFWFRRGRHDDLTSVRTLPSNR